MTEANQIFSKVTYIVDDNDLEVILKNNKLKYIVLNFEKYGAIRGTQEDKRNWRKQSGIGNGGMNI